MAYYIYTEPFIPNQNILLFLCVLHSTLAMATFQDRYSLIHMRVCGQLRLRQNAAALAVLKSLFNNGQDYLILNKTTIITGSAGSA